MWFFYALAFAIISSFSVIVAKKVMGSVEHYTYLLVSSIFTAPFLLTISLLFFDVPILDKTFWLATAVGTVISALAGILAYKAIQDSEVSLINPISAFNPAFTALISYFTLKETLSIKSIVGIIVIVIGAYILNITKLERGFLSPFRELVRHKGVQFSFIAYFLWAITPTFEKTAILHTSPQNPPFAAFIGQLIALFIYFPFVLRFSKNPIEKINLNLKLLLINGALGGAAITFAFLAFATSPLGVATGIFKLSLIFVPILSWIFFRENDIKERFIGSLIMLAGVVLLAT